jgi:NhaP-type Na+/H+ and K+/H+ antiporter
MAGIYLGIALLVVWLLGGFAALTGAFLDEVAGALQVLTLGFLFTLAMNAIIAVFLWLTEAVLIQAQGSQGND